MERADYRANLEMVLQYFGNRRLLKAQEVGTFLGVDYRTAKRHLPFSEDGYISAATLARQLSTEKGARK